MPINNQSYTNLKTKLNRLKLTYLLTSASIGVEQLRSSILKAGCQGKLVSTEAELAETEGRTTKQDINYERILFERRARFGAENPGKKYKEPVLLSQTGLPILQKDGAGLPLINSTRVTRAQPQPYGFDWEEQGILFLVAVYY